MKKYRWLFVAAAVIIVVILGGSVALLRGAPSTPAVTQTPTLSIALAEIGPRIVKQSPIAGQRLPLSPALELTFDREMNRDATSGAWTFVDFEGMNIPGELSWPSGRMMRFSPNLPLAPSTDYSGVIAPSALALDGSSPAAEIRLEFRTVDALAVGQVFPGAGAKDVEVNSAVTVIFNRPIVTLTDVEDSANLAVPITIWPSVAGRGEWVTTSVYVFTPDANLRNGTQYTLTVPAGLKDFTGESLAEDFVWDFTTRAPQIASFYLKNGPRNPSDTISNVLLDQAFVVTFVQPMNIESAAAALSLTDMETGQSFPYKLTWNEAKTSLTIEPSGRYKSGGRYNLMLAAAAEAADGGTLKEGLDVVFYTVPLPAILKVAPAPNSIATDFNSSLSISFNAPMDFNSLKGKVKITPAPKEELRWNYYQSNWTLYIYGLEPATHYTVSILPWMKDIYGHVISTPYSYSFTTGNLSSYASILYPQEPLVYRADGRQDFFFEYINLESAEIELYPLSLAEFCKLEKREIKARDFTPAASPIRTITPDLRAEKNSLARIKILLSDAEGKPLEPGYYFLGLKAGQFGQVPKFHQGAFFVVATDNITFKASGNDALAWVTDLETGAPAGGVELVLYNKKFTELGRATTNSDGLASWKKIADPYFVATLSEGRVAFTSQSWGSGVQGEVGTWQIYYRNPAASFVYVYTDRPLYRPGQEVQFTGVVRANDDLHYSLPSLSEVYITVTNWEEEIFSQTLPLSELGSFTGTFTLGEGVPLGSYTIQVREKAKDNIIGSISFRVAEYQKPEFQVGVSADKKDISPGGKVSFGIQADYYSGGKVSNAAVAWFMEYTPYFFYPPAAFQRFSFIDWDRDTGRSYYQSAGSVPVAEGEGVLNAGGHLDLSQVISPAKTKGDYTVILSANVTDVTGNVVSGGTTLVMHQGLLYAGIRPAKYVCRVGEEQTFDLVVLDWNGGPVGGQAVSVQIVQRRWYSVQELDDEGQLQWVTSVKDIPAASFANVVTDSSGKAQVSFTPAIGGIYKALVTVRDSKGDTHQASSYIWVSSDSYVPWRQTNDRSFSLIADKDSYEPGDTAEILLAQPFEGEVFALVTYERGHVYHSEVIKISGNSTVYRMPITGDMAPAEYLSVVVISGARSHGSPDFRMGVVRLNINTTQQTLDVKVTTDKPNAGPGDKVTYTVETKDAQGNPVPSEVSWALVDKALLALTPNNVPAILGAFYPLRSLSVRTSVGIVWSAEDYLAAIKETEPSGEGAGSGGGGKGEGELGIVEVRQDFKDTAFFRAETLTGADGKARVTVTLPENLTTWKMTVRAVTTDSRVGEAVHELISSKPLFISLQTPRFFVLGDSARIGAGVHNNGSAGMKVTVSLDAEGVSINSAKEQEVTVPGGQTAYVYWDVSVTPGATRVDLIARAEGGGFTDASKPAAGTLSDQGIPVFTYTVEETVGTSGMLTDANSVTEAFSPPPSADARLVVEISPSLAASWANGLSYLMNYPYLCLEQTVSRFLPNILARRAIKSMPSPPPGLAENIDQQVYAALQKIYANQNYDGGWGWWGGYESDLQTSAYVVLGLIEAKASGYTVKQSVVENGVDFLNSHLPDLEWNDPRWMFNRQAFILYVLSRAGTHADDTMLYQRRSSLGAYGKAFLALEMHNWYTADPRIDTLLSDLNNDAVLSAAGIHWEEESASYWDWNTDVRTTAIVLNAVIKLDPQNPLNASGVRWLMANRSIGRWGSTQETAWSIMALTNWVEASRELETEYSYAVGFDGNLWKDGLFLPANLADPIRLTQTLDPQSGDGSQYLVLARGAGVGNLYYTAYMTVTLPVAEVEALDRGIIVMREYFTLDDSKHPITQIQRGELVRVRLTVVASSALHYVLVDDPLPAGLEAIDASLSGHVAVPTVYTVKKFDETGWGWWYFDHKEVRDEKVVLSATYLPAGTFVYTYLARAGTAGTFSVIPVTASEFYFPDVSGRSAGSVFVVTP